VKEMQEQNEAKYSNMTQKLAQESNKNKKEEEVKTLGNKEWQKKMKKKDQYDEDVVKAIDTIKTSGSESLAKGLKEWNIQDGIMLYREKVYVPKDQELRREIIKEYHNSRLGGHSGRYKTTELVQRNY
jgi:hypothetical protein